MDHTSHYLLIVLALVLTWGDWRAFTLSAIVGGSLVLPVPAASATQFYWFCTLCEVSICLIALSLRTRASYFIFTVSAMLAAFHVLGWWLNGYPPGSPYRLLVRICEYAEIIACSLFSKPLIRLMKNAARFY